MKPTNKAVPEIYKQLKRLTFNDRHTLKIINECSTTWLRWHGCEWTYGLFLEKKMHCNSNNVFKLFAKRIQTKNEHDSNWKQRSMLCIISSSIQSISTTKAKKRERERERQHVVRTAQHAKTKTEFLTHIRRKQRVKRFAGKIRFYIFM